MDFFFNPQGVAIIGATTNPAKSGNCIVKNLLSGYRGPIYPVNPRYETIDGLPCYPSVSAIPDPVDMAIIFIPADQVPDTVKACADRGIKGVMIQSSGFSEAGPVGHVLQQSVIRICRETGIRVWGPNCMGMVDAVNRNIFSFLPSEAFKGRLLPGKVSWIVQSGMMSAGFLVDIMSNGIMGISKACSIGNKLDVNECDLLPWLIDDPNTDVIGCYLESIVEGRRFIDICRESPKPVVVLKGGRTGKGAMAALSHTASLAGNHEIVRGALAQAGIREVKDFPELRDLCRTLAMAPQNQLDKPGRIAVLVFSGGAGIIFTDFIEEMGLSMAELSTETKTALGRIFPEWMPVANPVDLFAALEMHAGKGINVMDEALKTVLADPNVDGVVLQIFAASFRTPLSFEALSALTKATGKPVCIWMMGERDEAFRLQKEGQKHGIPLFSEINRAVACMAALFNK